MELRSVNLTRYIVPLREGGSLPALAEADDEFKYVVKFRGAGHGTKSLVAELIGGMMAKQLGLLVPELVFVNVDEAFGRSEPDAEIQDLLKASRGLNIGLHFLSGAVTYDPVTTKIDDLLASKVVWLDSFLTNVDRTAKNTNMMLKYRELWLIDHGSMLYFHHSWDNWREQALSPFSMIKNHVLLPWASRLEEVNEQFQSLITPETIEEIVQIIPDDWLNWHIEGESPQDLRTIYSEFLNSRLNNSQIFIKEAKHAREIFI
jgi:hypothetical protein